MSGRALRWADQQAPQLQSDHPHQRHGAGQRNSGSHLPHPGQLDDTRRPRERPKSDAGVFAHFIDPFGLLYHDQSRYSGVRTVAVRT